jgi:tetratricopeptide (TPR) repeat protein
VDEALARDLGRRADAGVVLLGTLRKSGEAFALEVRGLDPHRDEYAFTVMERGRGKESVLEIVDRTALSLRRALEESDSAVRDADERIGDVVTRSLAAYQAYSEGNRCRERKTVGCWQHFERAVAIDPTFAMAHYELAVATLFGPDFTDRGLPALRDALRHVNRAPEAERIKIRAFAAWAEGRDATSDALYSEALLRHPDDYFVARGAGSFLMTRDEPDRALGALRRAVELAPTPGMAMEELADALSALGRHDELAELEARAEAVAAGGGSAEAVRALVVARAARGDTAGAIDAARLAVSQAASEDARDEARADLWMMQLQAGDLSVESDIRRRCDHEATYQLSTLLGLAGRRAEALRVLEFGERPECPPRSADEWQLLRNGLFFHASVARFSAGFTDVERARRHARWAQERNSTLAPHLAVYLAYLGDSATAADLARGLPPESPRRRAYEAVVLWRRGDRGGARAILDELTARTPWSSTPHGLPPSFLRGELAAEMGDDAAAIASLERFGSLHFYRLDFWSWAHPRSLYLLARSYERTGDMHRARERIAKLLALWRSADPDLPLLAEARALGRRLAVSADGTVDGN